MRASFRGRMFIRFLIFYVRLIFEINDKYIDKKFDGNIVSSKLPQKSVKAGLGTFNRRSLQRGNLII